MRSVVRVSNRTLTLLPLMASVNSTNRIDIEIEKEIEVVFIAFRFLLLKELLELRKRK